MAFTRLFLQTCFEQVRFMDELVEPNRLRHRILSSAEEESRAGALPARAGAVLEAALYRGELPRGEAGAVLGTVDRHDRRIVGALLERGVLTLTFPATPASRWMPGLFPESAL